MKHGWAFMDALTQAIEAWSAEVVHRDPGAFLYRKADLRHAVERSLFFSLASDRAVQAWFDAHVDGTPLPPAPAGPFFAMAAPYLQFGATAQQPASRTIMPPVGKKRWLRTEVANLSRLGRRPFRKIRMAGKADFLFLAIHPKFADFFQPILARIGGDAAYLCFDDSLVEARLAQAGLPCIALHHAFSRPSSSRGVLGHFLHLCRIFDRMTDMMEALQPRVILVPEGNAPIYEVALCAGETRGVATICLQHGAHGYTNPGFRNWHFSDFLAWGARFAKPFAHYNPGQHFTITGTPTAMPSPHNQPDDAPIHTVGFFLQKGAEIMREELWNDLLQFMGWAAATFPDVEIIIRDHPSQPPLTSEERAKLGNTGNIRFMPPRQFLLNDVLESCDVVIAVASTTLLEAIAAGALPFIFGSFYPKDYPDIVAEGSAIQASDLEQAKTELARLVSDPSLRQALRMNGRRLAPELFLANGAEGAQRIADTIRQVANNRTA